MNYIIYFILKKETDKITTLNLNEKNIHSLEGIQYLTNSTELNLSNNNIRNITPLAKLTKLTNLELSDNNIPPTEIEKPQYIDEDAINTVKDALSNGNEFSFFDKFKTGTMLKIEDLKNYKFSESEKNFLDSLTSFDKQENTTSICLVDIDNDGSDEITISQYQGGTMGIVYFAVLKKDNKGEYSETVNFDYEKGITFTLNNILSIVKLGNKNYLLVKETNYSDKTFSGVSIYSIINEKFAEYTTLDLYSKGTYTVQKGSDDSQYTINEKIERNYIFRCIYIIVQLNASIVLYNFKIIFNY